MKKRELFLLIAGLLAGAFVGVIGTLSLTSQAKGEGARLIMQQSPKGDVLIDPEERFNPRPKHLISNDSPGAIPPFVEGQDPESRQVLGHALDGNCKQVIKTYYSDDKVSISILTDPATGRADSVAVFAPLKKSAVAEK